MSYEQLAAHAQEIQQLAVKYHLEERYSITEQDGKFYSPQDPGGTSYDSGQSSVYTDGELAAKVQEAQAKFSPITDKFYDYLSLPDPANFDAPITGVKGVLNKLSLSANTTQGFSDPISGTMYPGNVELKDMTTAAEYLDNWDGVAAMTFVSNFATPFETITANQFNCAAVLANALEAEKALWAEGRKNIDTIAEQAISALKHMHDCGKNEWETAFSVVAAVVAITAATVATAGAAAPVAATIGLAAVGAGVGVAQTHIGQMEEAPKPQFSGESAEAVMNSVKEAIDKLKTYLHDAEQKIIDAMTNAASTVSSQRSNFVAKRPTLAGPANGQPGKAEVGVPHTTDVN